MPELPEVEAARRAIEENCLGKKIKRSVVADDAKVIDGVSPSDFEASLTGKTIVAAHRKGKNMWIQLDSPPFPSFQFGMAGAIYIKGVAVTEYKRSAVKDTDEWPSKYSKLFIELDDGLELSFTDKRRFAKVRLLQNPASAPPISELGPDALLEPMTKDELFKSLSKKKIGIKALILDQSFISGVGNWIADEVLYQARIHPLQSAASISKENCEALHNSLKEVIDKAVEVGADSSQFPTNWIFHSREKKPGKAFVDGKKIEFINAGGRTSAYVPDLQKLTGDQAGKELAQGKKKSSKKSKGEGDEAESEDEETAKPKGGKRTDQGIGKKTLVKRKGLEDEAESEDEETAKPKGGKRTGQGVGKKTPVKRKGLEDEAESEDEETAKPKGGKRTTQARGKRTPAKRKSNVYYLNDDDDDDDDDEGVETKDDKPATKKNQKGSAGNKRAPAKKKSQENEENSDGNDEKEVEEDKRVQVKGKKGADNTAVRQTKKRAK